MIIICKNFWDWLCLDFCINFSNHTPCSIIRICPSLLLCFILMMMDHRDFFLRSLTLLPSSSGFFLAFLLCFIPMMDHRVWFQMLIQKSKHHQSQKLLQIKICHSITFEKSGSFNVFLFSILFSLNLTSRLMKFS